MYQYFLGGFGNRSFIRPQYEVMEDGSLREVVDRFFEFPNGGTVSLAYTSDEDVNDIKNRLLKCNYSGHPYPKIKSGLPEIAFLIAS